MLFGIDFVSIEMMNIQSDDFFRWIGLLRIR